MNRKILLLLTVFTVSCAFAQNYQIDFAGSGSSTTVDSVHVLNLTQQTTLTLLGGDILNLLGVVGNNTIVSNDFYLSLYPNPISEKSQIKFFNIKEGKVTLDIMDMTGKIINYYSINLSTGVHVFEVSGLNAGVYTILVTTPEHNYSAKIISTHATTEKVDVKYVSSEVFSQNEYILKSGKSTVPMQYNDGEALLFTAFSGNYSTVNTLTPTQNQTLSFSFTPCTDDDGNNYAAVTIGTQVWMAENLKTTTYNDGTPIPNVTGNNDWAALTTPAYCWQQNDINNKDLYGALYNWFVVDTLSNGNKNPCPIGWHVPDSTEWRVLIAYAGGETTGGCKLKASGNIDDQTGLWWSPNICATNETGFSAQPANERSATSGSFYPLGVNADLWGTTDMGGTGDSAFDVFLNYNQQYVTGSGGVKKRGYSVRCIKD